MQADQQFREIESAYHDCVYARLQINAIGMRLADAAAGGAGAAKMAEGLRHLMDQWQRYGVARAISGRRLLNAYVHTGQLAPGSVAQAEFNSFAQPEFPFNPGVHAHAPPTPQWDFAPPRPTNLADWDPSPWIIEPPRRAPRAGAAEREAERLAALAATGAGRLTFGTVPPGFGRGGFGRGGGRKLRKGRSRRRR